MTELEQQRIFDLLRQAFPLGEPIPVSDAQAVLQNRGINCLDLGYFSCRDLLADLPGRVELRQRPESPLLYDLVLLAPAGEATTPAPRENQPAPDSEPQENPPAPKQHPQEGRCVLTEEDRKGLYRVLWEHYPLNFDIPLTDAAPLVGKFGYTAAKFFQGEGAPKAYHLFQALAPWVRMEQASTGVYFLVLEDAPEALEGTQSITGKRAGLTEEDRARICRCLASAFSTNTSIPLTALGNALVEGGVDFRALGFSRVTRLLPCLLEDLTQVMDDPRHVGQPELCVQLKSSILRYLPEPGEQPLQSEPEPVGNLDQDLPEILALLQGQFAPGSRQPMAAIFSLLAQHNFGARRYGLKGTDMLDRLGLTYEKVTFPEHPGNSDYLVTLPGAPAPQPAEPAPENQNIAPDQPPVQAAAAPADRHQVSAAEPNPRPEMPSLAHTGIPQPPSQWLGQVFFHPKTQAILAGFLGLYALDPSHLSQIARDYSAALAQGQVRWVPNKSCYSIPLSLQTPEGRATFLSIKVNDYPGGAPWRVNFVGFARSERPEHSEAQGPSHLPESQPAFAPVSSMPAPEDRTPAQEATAAEITGPVFTRLSDRDKLEIYHILLPLYPVGVPTLLSAAGTTLAHHGITPQRFGYARVLQMVSDMPEYIRISSTQPQADAPLVYSITLLPLPQGGELPAPVQDQANGDQPPFAMTERTIAFPASQQSYLSRYLNDPDGAEKLTEEQITEFQTSYAAAVSAGELVYDPAYQCYRFPLSLIARDGRALRATIKRSDRPVPPAWYVSFIEKCTDKGVRPGDKLKQFAFLGNIQEFLASLAAHAEGEKWGFSDNPQDYGILWNYISYTFYRLDFEGKVYIDPNGTFAGFNTGLLSRRFGEDLLAYFEPYSGPGGMKWKFVCFCSSTNEAQGIERKAVTLLVPLNLELPQYFSNFYDTMFDPNTRLESNFIHIVRDNLARFPLNWLHKQCDDHQRTKTLLAQIEEERTKCRGLRKLYGDHSPEVTASHQLQKQLFQQLGEAITDESDDNMCDLLMDMKDLFEGAVGRTVERCRRNFKLAVPCYFPTRNVMSMLLPISFSRAKNGAPCMALVAERQKNGIYLGRTVLTMRMAYNDARLLCRPSSEWLNTSGLAEETGLDDALDDDADQ